LVYPIVSWSGAKCRVFFQDPDISRDYLQITFSLPGADPAVMCGLTWIHPKPATLTWRSTLTLTPARPSWSP